MPFPLETLLADRPTPVTVKQSASLKEALALMIQNDFSQLPVVDDGNRLLGIVAMQTIVRMINLTDAKICDLRVMDVKAPAASCTVGDDDAFDAINKLSNAPCLVVTTNQKEVVGILTDYDASAYFRRRTEDMMLVEDIEHTLREFVRVAFPEIDDDSQSPGFVEALRQVRVPNIDRSQFKKAMVEYFRQTEEKPPSINDEAAKSAHSVLLEKQSPPTRLADLTFSELTSMLFQEERWDKYRSAISLDKVAIRKMLDQIRIIRNDLAHFKGSVTKEEHTHLVTCRDWLQNHRAAVSAAFASDQPQVAEPLSNVATDAPEGEWITSEVLAQIEAETKGKTGKYARLAAWLGTIPINNVGVGITFHILEQILRTSLPPSARQHVSWWANDSVGHIQSKVWLDAGWRVRSVNLEEENVEFARLDGSKRRHINTPTSLLSGRDDFAKKLERRKNAR